MNHIIILLLIFIVIISFVNIKPKYNLIYMANPEYGGWVSFTIHLSLSKKYPLYKVAESKNDIKIKDLGYGVTYKTKMIDELIKMPNILITAIDMAHHRYLSEINNATIVIHDPTELKPPLLEALYSGRFKVITIRKSMHKLLLNKYKIDNIFLLHPFYPFPLNKHKYKDEIKSISRIDFDKNIEIIIDANNLAKNNKLHVDLYGAENKRYINSKLIYTNYSKYYKGTFDKSFYTLNKLLLPTKFIVDMSTIKNDGGGTQYTFLEAIYFDCVLILNSKWTENIETPFINNINCYIVKNGNELSKVLNKEYYKSQKTIIKNSKKILLSHILAKGW